MKKIQKNEAHKSVIGKENRVGNIKPSPKKEYSEELYNKWFDMKCDIHNILNELKSFGIINDCDDYTNTLYTNIGEIHISSCSYYSQLEVNDDGDFCGDELAVTEKNYKIMRKIYDEIIYRRDELFKPNKTGLGLKEWARKIFDKPLPFKVIMERND